MLLCPAPALSPRLEFAPRLAEKGPHEREHPPGHNGEHNAQRKAVVVNSHHLYLAVSMNFAPSGSNSMST